MYYLPLYINNRKFHICHLDEVEKEAPDPKATFEFLVANTPNENVLFSIPEDGKFVSGAGLIYDQALSQLHSTGTFERRTLTLHFSDKGKKRDLNNTNLSTTLAMRALTIHNADKRKKELLITSAPNNRVTKHVEVIIHLEVGNRHFKTALKFHIAPPESMHEIIFDFGSDASQISISKFQSKKPQALDVINRLEEYFYLSKEDLSEGKSYLKKYHQYDPSEPDLFKSIFFIKKREGKFDYCDTPNMHKERDLIKILTKRKKQDTLLEQHFITPNLKLSELVDYFDEYIKFKEPTDNPIGASEPAFVDIKDDIYRNIINKFVHTALAKIQRSSTNTNKQYFNIILLVPNVYNQLKVYNLVENLYADLATYAKDYGFEGYEINTLSESDASFLGMLSDSNVQSLNRLDTNSNYLIIDAGKGTMDISIIRVGNSDRNFSSIYRTGIAGSGNIITYAFIETLATIWMGRNKTKRRKFVLEIIKANTTKKLRFMEVVERLKKRFSKADEDKKANINLFKPIMGKGYEDLEEVTQFLQEKLIEEGYTIQDYFGCITDAIEELSGEILLMVRKSGVKEFAKVLLAGRAFRFAPFVEAVIDKLDIDAVAYDAEMSKKICIVGATTNKTINFNSNLIGLPIISPVFHETEEKPSFGIKDFVGFFRRMFDQRARIPTVPPKITEIKVDSQFFLHGFSVKLSSFNVFIGGYKYLDNFPAKLKDDKTIYNIFFTGKEFKVRVEDDCYQLKPALPRYTVNPPVWKSIFPFLEWNDSQLDDIPILDLGEEFDYYFKRLESGSLNNQAIQEDLNELEAFDDDIMADLEKTTPTKSTELDIEGLD